VIAPTGQAGGYAEHVVVPARRRGITVLGIEQVQFGPGGA
jgi:hypothetical protein